MSVYLVTWDLNKERSNYASTRAALVARLDQYESIKDPGLDSVRFLSASWTADQVSADLLKLIDKNDRLIVTRLTSGGHQGWLSKITWEWINPRL